MSGTMQGGRKAYETNIRNHGPDFMRRIGALGGAKSRNGGFASATIGRDGMTGRERARIFGAIGGKISRRPKKV